MLIKCTCGNKDCQNEMTIDHTAGSDAISIMLSMAEGHYGMLYLDANSVVSLIRYLRSALNQLAGFQEED